MRKLSLFILFSLMSQVAFATQEQLPDSSCKITYENIPTPCFSGAVAAGSSENQQGFRNYSTKQFYALNWPVKDLTSQAPDLQALPRAFDIVVWQTWKTKDQLTFQYQPNLSSENDEELNLISSKLSTQIPDNFKSHVEFLHDTYIPDQDEKSLITPDGSKIYFQVYYNDIAINDLNTFNADNFNFTVGSTSPQKRGAVIVKAAWKIITHLPKDKQLSYHSSFACIFNNKSTCNIELVGLVGLHIANKMNPKNGSDPKCEGTKCKNLAISPWSWSTYEYRFNAPTVKNKTDFLQSYASYPWEIFTTQLQTSELQQCFNDKELLIDSPECRLNKFDSNSPANIVRFFPENDRSMKIEDLDIDTCQKATLLSLDYSTCLSIKAYNQPKFESPLKNYRFIENVWVDTLGNVQPQYSTHNPIQQIIRNTSMEPFDRKLTSSNQNCIACHRNAKFDGMFTVDQIVKGEKQR